MQILYLQISQPPQYNAAMGTLAYDGDIISDAASVPPRSELARSQLPTLDAGARTQLTASTLRSMTTFSSGQVYLDVGQTSVQ
jgi:hypothetical protein